MVWSIWPVITGGNEVEEDGAKYRSCWTPEIGSETLDPCARWFCLQLSSPSVSSSGTPSPNSQGTKLAEARLYLYRKAGREVWDAEMWLPDGRRRVWRTGIADRTQAEQAARARLEALLVPMMGGSMAAADASTSAAPVGEGPKAQARRIEAEPAIVEEPPPPVDARPSESVGLAPAPSTASLGEPSWTERFDRWFFRELASLWR
jgi:hypothetical protein